MKILIVEDNQYIAEALNLVLAHQNYVVEIASDGEEAWGFIKLFDYDLIILDISLPFVDGITLCRQMRSDGLQTPIMLLTGLDCPHEKAVGLDAGADDYMVKPFDEEELTARIRALLRRGKIKSLPILKWGSLQLEPISYRVTYNKQILALTPKEYALIELLLRNTHNVFSCNMILDHLWSYGDAPTEEAVRTHIKGLRMKLKAAGASPNIIETVYGIGYRLNPMVGESNQAFLTG
ncbi:MAG: response regulator transcription factor [Cyanobacteria bacterium J06573_2]